MDIMTLINCNHACFFFFFNDTATTEIYTLSLHDALPIFAVRAETRNRSRVSMKARCVLIAQYAAEKFGPQVPVPGYWTLREVWREWFGPGGTRPRYDRAAADIGASKVHVVVHRPGQVIALDTTPLPVKVRDGVFGDPVSV